MEKSPWKLEFFVTAAGTKIVQKWFWNETTLEERDALRDRANYLVNLEKNLWPEPYFKWFGDIGEIRGRVSTGALRAYGYFDEDRRSFVVLNGVVKKSNKDKEGVELARTRLRRLRSKEGNA